MHNKPFTMCPGPQFRSCSPDVGRADGVLVVDADEAEGFEGEEFAQWADIDERRPSAQPDFGLAACRHKAIDFVGIDHPLLTA
jgi:hypothetical protein